MADQLYLAAETDLGTVLGHIEEVQPSLMVLDSVQTIGTAEADGSPGGVTQVREVTSALVRVAKRRGMAVIIVGHVTKDGTVAGPRLLEHLVDVVLAFEGDRHSGFRMVRATKNRFGPADEVGCFEMVDSGIVEVPDPSGLFTSQHGEPVPGTAVTVTLEGRRPLLAEIQALVAGSTLTHPRRIVNGVESGRLAMVLAVLERRCGVRLSDRDVYSSTVGGARVSDPAADLAVALAVASAAGNKPVPQRIVALGEVGLAGELRRVPGTSRRLNEAARLGFAEAVIPAETARLAGADDDSPCWHGGALGQHPRSGSGGSGAPATGPKVTLLLPPATRLIRSAEGVGLVATARQDPPRSIASVGIHDSLTQSLTLTEGAIVASDLDRHRRLLEYLAMMAPGTPLRDGFERILRGRTGALVVLGRNKIISQISTGGFALGCCLHADCATRAGEDGWGHHLRLGGWPNRSRWGSADARSEYRHGGNRHQAPYG